MTDEHKYLLLIHIPKSKEYVFATQQLSEIRGGAALIDELICHRAEEFIRDELGEANLETISTCGDMGQFIVTATEPQLHDLLRELKGLFSDIAKQGLRLVCGKAEYHDNDYHRVLKQALYQIVMDNYEAPLFSTSQIHTGYVRECDSCSGMAADIYFFDKEEKVLCSSCIEKRKYGNNPKAGYWNEFSAVYSEKQNTDIAFRRPDSVANIAAGGSDREEIALVYGDANGIDRIVRQVWDKEQFRYLSKTVHGGVRESCYEALMTHCKPETDIFPADILFFGSDEFAVCLDATSAFPFAIDVAEYFHDHTREMFADYKPDDFFKEILHGNGLNLSIGVAFGKPTTPLSILFRQVRELMRNAKRAGAQKSSENGFDKPSYIDYHRSGRFNRIGVNDARYNHLTSHGVYPVKLYRKPYLLADAKALYELAENLVQLKISPHILKRLGEAPFLGKVDGTLECLNIYTNALDEERLAIWEALAHFDCIANMPWNEKNKTDMASTMLVDLIELVELML